MLKIFHSSLVFVSSTISASNLSSSIKLVLKEPRQLTTIKNYLLFDVKWNALFLKTLSFFWYSLYVLLMTYFQFWCWWWTHCSDDELSFNTFGDDLTFNIFDDSSSLLCSDDDKLTFSTVDDDLTFLLILTNSLFQWWWTYF